MTSSAFDFVGIMRAVPNVTLDLTDALLIAFKLAHCGLSPSLGHSCRRVPAEYVNVRSQESDKLHGDSPPCATRVRRAMMCEPTWTVEQTAT